MMTILYVQLGDTVGLTVKDQHGKFKTGDYDRLDEFTCPHNTGDLHPNAGYMKALIIFSNVAPVFWDSSREANAKYPEGSEEAEVVHEALRLEMVLNIVSGAVAGVTGQLDSKPQESKEKPGLYSLYV